MEQCSYFKHKMKFKYLFVLIIFLIIYVVLSIKAEKKNKIISFENEILKTLNWNLYKTKQYPGKDLEVIPVIEDGKRVSYMQKTVEGKQITLLSYETNKPVSVIINFYLKSLSDKGWVNLTENKNVLQFIFLRNKDAFLNESILQMFIISDNTGSKSIINFIIQVSK